MLLLAHFLGPAGQENPKQAQLPFDMAAACALDRELLPGYLLVNLDLFRFWPISLEIEFFYQK